MTGSSEQLLCFLVTVKASYIKTSGTHRPCMHHGIVNHIMREISRCILSASVPGPSDAAMESMERWMRSLPRKENVYMKKKMSVALVLALVLVMLAIGVDC